MFLFFIFFCLALAAGIRRLVIAAKLSKERDMWIPAYNRLKVKIFCSLPDELDEMERQVDAFFDKWYYNAPRQVTEATCHLMERLYERRRIVGPSNTPTLPAF